MGGLNVLTTALSISDGSTEKLLFDEMINESEGLIDQLGQKLTPAFLADISKTLNKSAFTTSDVIEHCAAHSQLATKFLDTTFAFHSNVENLTIYKDKEKVFEALYQLQFFIARKYAYVETISVDFGGSQDELVIMYGIEGASISDEDVQLLERPIADSSRSKEGSDEELQHIRESISHLGGTLQAFNEVDKARWIFKLGH